MSALLPGELPTALQRSLFPLPDAQGAEGWDELRDANGRLRPAWERFFSLLPRDLTPAELDRRLELVGQQIRADGVTHNVHGADGAAARPWSLELLPMIIEPADWASIERATVQRAQLMNAVLADAYGAQHLLHEGLLPPALLFRHPGYLRPLHGVVPPGGLHVHIVAFDLARGHDGTWWFLSRRTQSPSGLGYVLHNRLIVSRLFPEAFREMRVQHIASSYRRLLDTLEAMGREVAQGAAPRLALLTSGPYTETWFEHAYLARYLGLTLVEGNDLTVRNDRLYLKTVEGLQPLHGLLRRLDDDFCDPLELRPDSALGVPGLLQAIRAGNVVLANALGSGFLESSGIHGFLPGIAQRLLGEDLHLPTLPTWWCGEDAAWQDVRDSLAGHMMRPVFKASPEQTAFAVDQAGAERTRRLVEADPEAWAVQEHLKLSRAPLWQRGGLLSRPAMLRVYAIADPDGRWHVLPGGMTRVAAGDHFAVSMQSGGSSLDTWVLTEGAVDTFSMLPSRLSVDDIVARRRPVSSRTGENLFWVGRYTERTEQSVRLARATLNLIDDDEDAPASVLDAVSELCVLGGLCAPGTPSAARSPQVFERSLLAALADAQGATSIAFNLSALAGAAGALRERLSPEHWGLVRSAQEDFAASMSASLAGQAAFSRPGVPVVPALAQVRPALDRLAVQLAAITGAQTDRMTRDHGWRLLTIGRLVERLIGMSSAVGAMLAPGALQSPSGVDLLLDLFDSVITFRSRYQRHGDLIALVDVLVLDDSNPRALAGTLRRLRTELRKLPGAEAALQELLAMLPATGVGFSLDDLRGEDDARIGERLVALAGTLADAGSRLSDEIAQRYFALAEASALQRV